MKGQKAEVQQNSSEMKCLQEIPPTHFAMLLADCQ